MRSRTQTNDSRSPSPDVETDEDLRREHFSYYSIPYSPRKRRAKRSENEVSQDLPKEDPQSTSRTTVTVRRDLASSSESSAHPRTNFPLQVCSKSHRSAVLDLIDRECNALSLLNKHLSRLDGQIELNRQMFADLDQRGPSHSAQYNNHLRTLTAKLGAFDMKASHDEDDESEPTRKFSRRGAISAQGAVGVEELSAALSIDLHMRPEGIADGLSPEDIVFGSSRTGTASRFSFTNETEQRAHEDQHTMKPQESRKSIEEQQNQEQEEKPQS